MYVVTKKFLPPKMEITPPEMVMMKIYASFRLWDGRPWVRLNGIRRP